jgi:hypothetical protein
MRSDVTDDRREVACLADSLSEQDLDNVGGASGREGLRRTAPSTEKYPLPWRMVTSSSGFDDEGSVQGVESS